MAAINDRFALLELDDIPTSASPEPTAADLAADRAAPPLELGAPEPEPEPVEIVSDYVCLPAAREPNKDTQRAMDDEALAVAAGFSPKPPIYAIGTPINETGRENLAASRADFDALPSVEQAMTELAAAVRAEDRADVVANLAKAHMSDDGRLHVPGCDPLDLTPRSMRLLGRIVTPSGGQYLRNCPAALRALNVNHWLPRLGREMTLRTRVNGRTGQREMYSVVGKRYTAFDIDKVAEEIARVAPPDARCDAVYDGHSARVNVLFHTDIKPEHGVAGEIFKAGVSLRTADDGTGAIHVDAEMWRNLCLNLIILDHAKQKSLRRSHTGNGIADAINAGMENALDKVGSFAAQWGEATRENLIERYQYDSMPELLERLARNRVVSAPGCSVVEMHDRLVRAWEREPGYSRTHVINAITRAAHTEEWRGWAETEDLERQAGQLLYAKVWDIGHDAHA